MLSTTWTLLLAHLFVEEKGQNVVIIERSVIFSVGAICCKNLVIADQCWQLIAALLLFFIQIRRLFWENIYPPHEGFSKMDDSALEVY